VDRRLRQKGARARMPEVTVDVELFCARCGAGLCNKTMSTQTRLRVQPAFQVEPCEQCLNNARQWADMEGYNRACGELKE